MPLSVHCHFYLGGFWNQLAWGLFGFGMIFFWVFAANADVESLIYFQGALSRVQGTVTSVDETNFREGRQRHRSRGTISAVRYEFKHNGQLYRRVSFAAGTELAPDTPVDIEFPVGDPDHSRIVGLRCQPFAAWAAFVLVLPLAGLAMIVVAFRFGAKALRLLRAGRVVEAALVGKESASGRVNSQIVYKLRFEFTAGGKQCSTTFKTHHIERFGGESETLLYDPMNPGDALPLDALPRRTTFDGTGKVTPRSLGSALLVMLLPALTIIGNTAICLVWFMD